MKPLLKNIPPAQLSLEQLHKQISLEFQLDMDIKGHVTNLVSRVGTSMRDRTQYLKQLFSKQSELSHNLDVQHNAVQSKLPDIVFLAYAEQLVMVPENFQGNLIEYAEDLIAVTKSVYPQVTKVLDGLVLDLSAFISQKNKQTSLVYQPKHAIDVERIREVHTNTLQVYFPSATGLSRQKLKHVLRNKAELDKLHGLMKQLIAINKTFNLNALNDKVNKVSSLLEIITGNLDDQAYDHANPALAELSENVYAVGQLVEYAASLVFESQVLEQVSIQLYAKIDKDF